jgi:hypothetical protein
MGSIVTWELLPHDKRRDHPMILVLTENMTTKLACLFAHILMFLDVSILVEHIAGEDNAITDYILCAKNTNNLPAFSFNTLQNNTYTRL